MKSVETFSFHLDGDSSVDAIQLASTIKSFAELTKAISNTEDPEAFLKLNITTFKNGSFEVIFQTVCEIAETIMSDHEKFATLIASAVIGAFKIKKFLKNETPKNVTTEGENIKIERNDGSFIYAPKASGTILSNVHIDNMVVNIVAASNESNGGNGFSIGSHNDTVKCSAEDVQKMNTLFEHTSVESLKIHTQTMDAYLEIKKAVYVGKSKWTFVFKNISIDATIEDEEWLTKVQDGDIRIDIPKHLHAKLQIDLETDKDDRRTITPPKYKILKVYNFIDSNDIPADSQTTLF
ncbi:hypothetical protein [Anaerotignum sp. MB30-C6]|uniref:hypothetical protein n=1 Tax=Anaerotignum sp. MB30-C6 TaxID=3070814 RepID=UPI0027DEA290|nr:hypothetical protein [Anaerotignum sp. MB30-C6]WMI81795.1 hypothetical protein RBQ60_03450 [Anaerotignum sp. MB30-C6]